MPDSPSRKSRLATELGRYAIVSGYLFICFVVIFIYEASQSDKQEAASLLLSNALIKALVMGKFILIGGALKPGTRIAAPTLLHRVAWRTIGMLVLLIVFKLIEELVLGLFHDKAISLILDELARQTWLSLLGPTLLMLLILVPLMTSIELDRVLGTGGLKGLLVEREDP